MADSEANTKAPPAEDGKAADAAAVKDENATNGKNGEPPSGSSTKEEDGDKKVTKKEEEDAKEEEETNEEVAKSPARGKPGKKRKSASIATPGEDGESGANPTTNTSNNNQRERRVRKSIEAFNPTDFDKAEKSIVVVTGRGVPLGDLEATRTAVESHAQSADAVALAHRLLFSVRGKVAKKDMVANILAFSGYLPPKQEGVGKDKQDDLDEQYEAKFGAKAYKLVKLQVRDLCDFFGINRASMAGKDELVDALLDFLGEPSKERLKGVKAKKSVSKKKTKPKKSKASLDENEVDNENEDNEDEYDDVGDDKVEEEEEEEGDDNVDGEEEQKGEKAKKKKVKKMPSDESLRKWVRAYVRCHNMKNSTIKNALEIAGDKFGVDLTEQKARLKELLTEEI